MQNLKAALIIHPSNIDPKATIESLDGFDIIVVGVKESPNLKGFKEIVYPSNDLGVIKRDLLGKFKEPIFFINSYEKIASGKDLILASFDKENKAVTLFEKNTMWQEPRLLSPDAKVFGKLGELTEKERVGNIPGAILTYHSKPDFNYRLELCKEWFKERQHDLSVMNHLAYAYLSVGDIDSFFKYSREFIHKSPPNSSSIMMKYNLARTKLHKGIIDEESINYIAQCIATRPQMAEFWCLAAEYQMVKKNYSSSKLLFENAMIAGSFREHFDGFPIIINAYRKYPQSMIQKIIDAENQVEYIALVD